MRDPVYEDLDRLYEREEYLRYCEEQRLEDEMLEEKAVNTPAKAVRMLLDILLEGEHQTTDMIARCLSVLAKEYGFSAFENIDEDEIQVFFPQKVRKEMESRENDYKMTISRVRDRLLSLREQVYGTKELDSFSIDADFTTALWCLGNPVSSNRNINIQRKV